ncbi:MAG: ArgE/DapE family deacylase [Anaerolineaceae bacterium]|nr:ArgE/DapE family deacylase [Anaerolineaceae bacterium]
MIDETVKNNIFKTVDSLEEEMVKLISEIIQIPSINPYIDPELKDELIGGETRVNEYLKPVMDSIGLVTDLWEVEKGRANLVGVCKGTGGGRSLIFNGHVDTVAPGPLELWDIAGPYSGEVIDGKIYGRGATDMKGADVAAIIALKALLKAGYKPKGDVILESVAAEEMMQHEVGTSATVARGYKADAAIVVESSAPPHRLAILTASPGVLILKVTARGKAAHTSMRDEVFRAGGRGRAVAVSAIDKAMIIYNGLLKLEEEWGQTKTHPAFTRPGHFTLCPATFAGGLAGIAFIPAECYITYVIWHAPQETMEQVKSEIETHIHNLAQTDPWLRDNPPELDWSGDWWWPPYDIPKDSPICSAAAAAYEAVLNEPAKYYGFTAVDDATFLNQAGIPTITMGPGSIEVAHTANEYIEIKDLLDAAKIYALTIVEWCGI